MSNSLLKDIFSKGFWITLTSITGVLMVGSIVGTHLATTIGAAAINMALGTKNTITIFNPNEKPTNYFTSDYDNMTGADKYLKSTAEALFEEDKKIIEEAEGEGCVLLWNKEEALPLKGNERVSPLSHSSVDIVECGSGSGWVATSSQSGKDASVNLKDALVSRGFEVNQTLWDFYKSGAGSSYKRTTPNSACTEWRQWNVNEVPWNVYTSTVKSSFASYKDVGLVVISRTGGEYSDLHFNYKNASDFVGDNDRGLFENTSADGGYLGLTNQEEELLSNVTKGEFDKVVLLLNTPNPLQFKDLAKYYNGIDACMWIGQPGSSGINAVCDLLKGKDMNGNEMSPSGRLTDTFSYDLNAHPATVNDGNYKYSGDLSKLTKNNNQYNTYMVYQEGIYVGYRYFETRYADFVLNRGNANSSAGAKNSTGGWNYNEEVAFPFGYGDSYSKFEYSNFTAIKNSQTGDYDISVDVKNVGNHASKEVVQAYLQKPYTAFDQEHLIEKSAIELVGYAKTKMLAKNESQNVKFTVKAEDFKTYDANYHKTYIIEAGDYYLTLGSDAHSALNNILVKQGHSIPTTKLFGDYAQNNTPCDGSKFVQKFTLKEDLKTYSKSTQTGYEITNAFDNGDINKYKYKGTNEVTYLSRKDWNATYPKSAPTLTMNAELAADLKPNTVPDDTGIEMPKYSVFKSGSETKTPDIYNGDRVAIEFKDAPLYPGKHPNQDEIYNHRTYAEWEAMWNQLLDQMTFAEQSLMVANAYHQICGAESIGLPSSKQENGPVGITKRGDFPVPDSKISHYYFVSYPCVGILAASFNDDVVERVGEHKSEDMLFLGYNGIYGPGVNMHRTPFGGRAFEYPSEDPYLAGRTSYYESRGIENKGCMAYAKHFALNDTETNRRHVGVWSPEQGTREIYLKAFEMCFAEGGASATMNSFSRVGAKWNGGCYDMMTIVLRNEWGWDGINITDWMSNGPMSYVDAIMAGTDSFDGNGTTTSYDTWKNNAAVCQALRNAARRIIYNVVRTNAMNGITLNTRILEVTPWWETTLNSIIVGTTSGFGCCAIMTVLSFVLFLKKEEEIVENVIG